MRRIAGVVVEAAWALLLLTVEPEAGAAVVVMGTGSTGMCVCMFCCVDRENKGGGERVKETKERG